METDSEEMVRIIIQQFLQNDDVRSHIDDAVLKIRYELVEDEFVIRFLWWHTSTVGLCGIAATGKVQGNRSHVRGRIKKTDEGRRILVKRKRVRKTSVLFHCGKGVLVLCDEILIF